MHETALVALEKPAEGEGKIAITYHKCGDASTCFGHYASCIPAKGQRGYAILPRQSL